MAPYSMDISGLLVDDGDIEHGGSTSLGASASMPSLVGTYVSMIHSYPTVVGCVHAKASCRVSPPEPV